MSKQGKRVIQEKVHPSINVENASFSAKCLDETSSKFSKFTIAAARCPHDRCGECLYTDGAVLSEAQWIVIGFMGMMSEVRFQCCAAFLVFPFYCLVEGFDFCTVFVLRFFFHAFSARFFLCVYRKNRVLSCLLLAGFEAGGNRKDIPHNGM